MKEMVKLVVMFLCLGAIFAQSQELKLGDALILNDVTKVSEINANPDKYLNKRVQIEGLIVEVCAARGCWMNIASDIPFEKIQVKVVDGEIVFPLEAKGRMARVEGIVQKLSLTQKKALKMAKHRAEEQGTDFDPTSITGPVTFYRVRGLGAVITN